MLQKHSQAVNKINGVPQLDINSLLSFQLNWEELAKTFIILTTQLGRQQKWRIWYSLPNNCSLFKCKLWRMGQGLCVCGSTKRKALLDTRKTGQISSWEIQWRIQDFKKGGSTPTHRHIARPYLIAGYSNFHNTPYS